MNLAKNLGSVLEENSKLSWAGQTRLLQLARLAKAKGASVESLLRKNEVFLDFDPKNSKEIKKFHDEIENLTKEVKPVKKEKSIKQTILQMKKVVGNCATELKTAKDDSDFLNGIKPGTIQKAIKKVEKLLKQLQKAEKLIAGREADREAA